MQQGLALPATAIEIARFTVFLQLRHVAANGPPTRNLTQIIFSCGVRNNIGNTIGTSRADRPDESNLCAAILTAVAMRSRQNNSAMLAVDGAKASRA